MYSKKLWRLVKNQRVDYEFKMSVVRQAKRAIWRKDITILYEDIVTGSEEGNMYYSSEFVIEFVVKSGVDRFVEKQIKKEVKKIGGKKYV